MAKPKLKSKPKNPQATRLRNKIRRLEARLKARDKAKILGIGVDLCAMVGACNRSKDEKVKLVDAVEDYLDHLIEPRSEILEWLSDVAIDVAAALAVEIWEQTENWIEDRLDRLRAKLAELEAKS